MPRRDDIKKIDLEVPYSIYKKNSQTIKNREFSMKVRLTLRTLLISHNIDFMSLAKAGKKFSKLPSKRMSIEFTTDDINKLDRCLNEITDANYSRRHIITGIICLMNNDL